MSEEEIIKYTKNIINATYIEATSRDENGNITEQGLVNKNVIQGLLDLYNKEKEKNKILDNMLLVNKEQYEFIKNKDNYISKDKIIKLLNKYKPNQTNTFIKSQENYIKLVKEIQELLEERN